MITSFRSKINLWRNEFRNKPVIQITTEAIETVLEKRIKEQGLSPATRNRDQALISRIFSWGIERNKLKESSAKGIKMAREDNARTRCADPEKDEIRRLLSVCNGDLKLIVLTALHTGMRQGEIFDLKWPQVNLPNRTILILKSKSGKKREVTIDDTLFQTLKGLPSRFKGEYVFPSRTTGGRRNTVNKKWKEACEKAKIKNLQFRDLRHTFASLALMGGCEFYTCQKILGHSSRHMTERYSHLSNTYLKNESQKWDKALRTVSETVSVQISGKHHSP